MGNNTSRVVGCFAPSGNAKDDRVDLDFLEPLDEGLGHSFCYVRPPGAVDSPALTPSNSERYTVDPSTLDSETCRGSSFGRETAEEDFAGWQRPNKGGSAETTFGTISGASVSANASTARTPNVLLTSDAQEPAAAFESTASFAAVPLQPAPRGSGPLNGFLSGPLERGFASGPLERGAGFMSGPLDKGAFMSGPLDFSDRSDFSAPLAYGRKRAGFGWLVRSMSRPVRGALSRTFARRSQGPRWMQRFFLHPMTRLVWHPKEAKLRAEAPRNCAEIGPSEAEYNNTRNLQWAHGKAGEDRVHVVLSEEHGWLYIGIYDGFSGPDAPDFLMSNLYKAVDKELEGLLWDFEDKPQKSSPTSGRLETDASDIPSADATEEIVVSQMDDDESGKQQCKGSYEGQYNEGVVPLQKNGGDSRAEPTGDRDLDKGSVQVDEIVEEKTTVMDADQQQDVCECSGDNAANLSTDVVGLVNASKDTSKLNAADKCRKSKRLYELLQLELLSDCESNASQLASEFGSSRDLQENHARVLSSRESIPGAGLVASIKGETSGRTERTDSLRESEGVSGEDTKHLKLEYDTSISALESKQMARKTILGSKLRRIYRKQKTLRKKLFPWNYDWHRDQQHEEERVVNQPGIIRRCKPGQVDHNAVLQALTRALEATEEAYMAMVETSLDVNPELALMGSCVLVMLMKDQDVYVINLGDSRVILAQDRLSERNITSNLVKDNTKHRNRSRESLVRVELDRISEESPMHNPNSRVCTINKNKEISLCRLKLRAVQLSTDHSTSIEEEVLRIKAEHTDDAQAVLNERVKGQLKVTRAFGAGFLKKPKFNEALLEMFQIDYIGSSPYLSCVPSVIHHRLCSSDRFLVLSSDGLYQYFSNEDVVSHVAWFMENVQDGDPAQYLISELLFRAAKKNGMDFHELLDIPQGDRRKYHDDVSVMVISLEGRIWRSAG
ncbi:protein phosphatase 2C 32 [Iris pallida]|uniref:protein-serine/threonine phosphatase n=1 Tax=Iris pallida TaxID=29817 RepID=A0AAX6IKI9_IRIPA|nr:protein phosphatase 2C 32 [Iris pallida]